MDWFERSICIAGLGALSFISIHAGSYLFPKKISGNFRGAEVVYKQRFFHRNEMSLSKGGVIYRFVDVDSDTWIDQENKKISPNITYVDKIEITYKDGERKDINLDLSALGSEYSKNHNIFKIFKDASDIYRDCLCNLIGIENNQDSRPVSALEDLTKEEEKVIPREQVREDRIKTELSF